MAITIEKETLKNMIAELTKERDEFVTQANSRIAFLNGKIEALSSLLAERQPADAELLASEIDEAPSH